MNIAFYGGKQAGLITLLSIIAKGYNVKIIIPEDDIIKEAAKNFNIPIIEKKLVNEKSTIEKFKKKNINLFVCCHARKILKQDILKFNCINLHPCLYKYKGADPVHRLIKEKNTKASVAVHYMIEEVDAGEVIIEIFKEVEIDSIISVYNQIYSLYSVAICKALDKLNKQ